jgi:hypothetical protein
MPSGTACCRSGDADRGGGGHGRALLTDWVAEVERTRAARCAWWWPAPDDMRRYTTEFFALAARCARRRRPAQCGWRQLRAAGGAGRSNKQLDANDQGVVQVVDWLWQYAFDQRASDIHLEPRREQGAIRFRIDGVLHTVYQVPLACWQRDDRAHQAAGPHGRGGEAPPAGRPHQDRATRAATRSRCACPRCPRPSARRW